MDEKDTQKRLNMFLGPEYISFKNTGYSEEPYLEGANAIHLANEIFGYDGWSSEVKEVKIEDVEEKGGRYTISSTALIRVTLSKTGVHREDIGFGVSENIAGKGKAMKNAQKSAVTDALKRALRQFGNALGNCCHDKEYIKAIRRMKKHAHPPVDESQMLRPNSSLRSDESARAEQQRAKKKNREYIGTRHLKIEDLSSSEIG